MTENSPPGGGKPGTPGEGQAHSKGNNGKEGNPGIEVDRRASQPYIVREKGAAGLRGMETTSIFRVVNFELFAKPNKFIMVVGLTVLSGCVGYIAYWNATAENRKDQSVAMDEKGNFTTRKKVSRWD